MENQKFNAVVWFEIYVNDMDRAAQFYEKVLQLQLQHLSNPNDGNMEMRAFPGNEMNPGASGTLVCMRGVPAGGNSTLVYFGSEDCANEESRITAAGGKVHQPKTSIGPFGFIVIGVDTEGNLFGIHSMK